MVRERGQDRLKRATQSAWAACAESAASVAPARGPPLWDDCSDAQSDDGAQIEPADWDMAAQPTPDYEVDQRINW
ncbi:MAG: hypothetical protein Fur007_10900 [Rhodoferax sp.]